MTLSYFSKRRFLRWTVRCMKHRDNAESIARGLAIGVFVGICVPWGAQLTLAFLLAWLFGVNRLVSMLATNVSNFVTTVPMYIASYWIGRAILWESRPVHEIDFTARAAYSPHAMLTLIQDLGLPFLVGNLLLGIAGAILSYWMFTRLARHYHRRHPLQPVTVPVEVEAQD